MTVWRDVGDAIIAEIDKGVFAPGDRLPSDSDLAVRFGIHRHTVRRALSHLESEGLVRMVRGHGTFVSEDVMDYRIGIRTRFEQNLMEHFRAPSRTPISVVQLPASDVVAVKLGLGLGDPTILVSLLGSGDRLPISFGHNYFSMERHGSIADYFRDKGKLKKAKNLSVTSALRSAGVSEFQRKSVSITARLPTTEETRHLKISRNEYVLETEAVNVDEDGNPVMYATTAFPSSRIRFTLDLQEAIAKT